MSKRKIIKRRIAYDLIVAVYKAEGWWPPREGERRVERVKTLYTLTADLRKNVYIATPKETQS